jgi:rhodanese-related sulfurtransferase
MQVGDVAILDVRGHAEWEAGHLPGVENIPLGYVTDRLDEIPRCKPLVVYCQSGARSAIAASVLRAKGLTNAVNLTGGFAHWQNAGHPVEREVAAGDLVGARSRSAPAQLYSLIVVNRSASQAASPHAEDMWQNRV